MSTIKVTNLRHESAASSNITLDSSNNAVVAGTLGCTGNLTVTSGNLVVSSGNGIDFSAAGNAAGMTSELLDDYEEGTWTPTWGSQINAPTGANGITVSSGTAIYVKVGTLVHVAARVSLNNATGSFAEGKTVILGGLPFAANSSSTLQGPMTAFASNGADTAGFVGDVETSGLRLVVAYAGGTSASSEIRLGGTYRTN